MQTPMCIAPSSGCALGVHARVRWCEREVGVHGEPATRAPREGDRESPGPRERRAVGSHAERVPGRRDPSLVALNRTACLIDTNREVANARPHAAPLRLHDPVHALDEVGDRAESDQLGCAQAPAALEVPRAYARLPAPEPLAELRQPVLGHPELAGDLEQVAVGVAQVDRLDRAEGARALHRPLEDGHPTLLEVAAPDLERLVRQEAEVARAWRRPRRLQPELRPGRVQVDLLRSESQREPARREPHRLHAEDPAGEVARGVEIADGEHQGVEAVERHPARWGKTDSGRDAETIPLGVATISLILRSTATLERMYASSRESSRSVTRWSIM